MANRIIARFIMTVPEDPTKNFVVDEMFSEEYFSEEEFNREVYNTWYEYNSQPSSDLNPVEVEFIEET